MTDHLGNVRAVFVKTSSGNTDMVVFRDYYPFGMEIAGRSYTDADGYRYGYQGQYAEKDPETGWNAFELRMYDSRIGRWLSVDREGQYYSSYLGIGNNPISLVDPDGGWVHILIGGIIGGVVDGIKAYKSGKRGAQLLAKIGYGTLGGAAVAATGNPAAGVAISALVNTGGQIIDNIQSGKDWKNIEASQVVVSAVSTYIGGKIGSPLDKWLNKSFSKMGQHLGYKIIPGTYKSSEKTIMPYWYTNRNGVSKAAGNAVGDVINFFTDDFQKRTSDALKKSYDDFINGMRTPHCIRARILSRGCRMERGNIIRMLHKQEKISITGCFFCLQE